MSVTRSFRSSGLKYALPLLLAAVTAVGPAATAGPADGPFTEESKLACLKPGLGVWLDRVDDPDGISANA